MKYSLDEQETHLFYEPSSKRWMIETNYQAHIKKFQKMAQAFENIHTELDKDGKIVYFSGSVNNLEDFTINPFPRKKNKRELSDEEREILRNRLSTYRRNKNGGG